jgi:hypothetical protein
MGYKAVVYGRIEGSSEANRNRDAPYPGAIHHHNRCVVQGLPDTDSDWPFLTRHVFSLSVPKLEWNHDRGIYKGQIIHFGANLKADLADTDFAETWLQKFEQQLLTPLVWRTAAVHFEHEAAGKCTVSYAAESSSLREVLEDFCDVGVRINANIMRWAREPAIATFR